MAHEAYKAYKPEGETWTIINTAEQIIDQYQSEGLRLTLRQLYYQFVARALLPNTERSYKKLGNIISRGRLGGLLDWDAIEDRVRQPVVWAQYAGLDDLLEEAFWRYRRRRLVNQPTYVELWVEKDALAGVLRPIAAKYHVTLMVNRGYSSSSAMKEAGDRIRDCVESYGSSDALVLYLGDLDPSGEDMVRDIRDRLGGFINYGQRINWTEGETKGEIETGEEMRERKPWINFKVEKLALTIDQVDEHEPPPNPTKLSDSRAKDFVAKFGYESWEVDALPPTVLRDIITEALTDNLDLDEMERIKDKERKDKRELRAALKKIRGEEDDEDDYEDEDDDAWED